MVNIYHETSELFVGASKMQWSHQGSSELDANIYLASDLRQKITCGHRHPIGFPPNKSKRLERYVCKFLKFWRPLYGNEKFFVIRAE